MEKDYMELAIKMARQSDEPLKCGVVIVKNGKVLAETFNSQRCDCNSTAHAEIKAIGLAGRVLSNKNLDGCTVYGTCEPCTMCLSAMIFAKVEKLVFGVSLKDVSPVRIDINIDEFIEKSPHKIKVIKNFMEQECKDLYTQFLQQY